MGRDFEKAVREAEAAREQQTLNTGAAYRMQQAILEGASSGRSALSGRQGRALATAAVLAVVVLLAVVATFVGLQGGEEGARGNEQLAEAPVTAPSPAPEPLPLPEPVPAEPERRVLAAGQTWQTPERVAVATKTRAVVTRAPDALRVLEGTARFEVDPRAAGEPDVVVEVSHGRIEVLGTEFTVVQREDGGQVTLHEGRIRFTHEDGTQTVMSPGETLQWPPPPPTELAEVLPPAPGPAPEPRAPRKPQPQAPVDVPALISEVETLRQQGRYEAAVTRLSATLSRPLPDETHERLSYELGDILTFQLRDATRGCEVWAAHVERFGQSGRYGTAVRSAQRSLGCR